MQVAGTPEATSALAAKLLTDERCYVGKRDYSQHKSLYGVIGLVIVVVRKRSILTDFLLLVNARLALYSFTVQAGSMTASDEAMI
jgi:hypothetical protein